MVNPAPRQDHLCPGVPSLPWFRSTLSRIFDSPLTRRNRSRQRKIGENPLFAAVIEDSGTTFGLGLPWTREVSGARSNSNPVSGSAVWEGKALAYSAHPTNRGSPATGRVRIEATFYRVLPTALEARIDQFSNFDSPVTWRPIRPVNGSFSDSFL